MDLHSGMFGGAVANPITALAQLLATLHDKKGRVAIEGFYDKVKPLEDWEREAWRKLPLDGDKEILRRDRLAGSIWRERLQHARATVGAPDGGDQRHRRRLSGAGHEDGDREPRDGEAHLPARAEPGWRRRSSSWRRSICGNICPPGVTLEITDGHSGPWYLTDPHSGVGQAAQRALRDAFDGKEPALDSRRRQHSDHVAIPHHPRRGNACSSDWRWPIAGRIRLTRTSRWRISTPGFA